jgi:DNA-binding protein YbaB
MSSIGDEELLAEMTAALNRVREQSDRLRDQVRRARTTVQDRERLLSATVDGHGELRQLVFYGDAYRDLAPAELADLIVQTVMRAKVDARRKAMAGVEALSADLPGLGDTARRATTMDELIEGIVGLVSTKAEGGLT